MSAAIGKLAWPLPLEALVLGAAGRAGLGRGDLVPLGPWLARAAAGGPTSARGPLAHELQLPNHSEPRQVGLTVRVAPSAPPLLDDAERWSSYVLGADALAAVRQLPVAAPRLSWHGGVHWIGGAWRLVLFGVGSAADVAGSAVALGADLAGIEHGAALVALGVEIGAGGLEDARTFERMDLGWDAPPGTSHRLLGRLGGTRARHTIVTSFSPGTPASGLGEHDVDPEWLNGMVVSLASAGFSLDAAAHQLDLYDDGARAIDVFVTVGAPAE